MTWLFDKLLDEDPVVTEAVAGLVAAGGETFERIFVVECDPQALAATAGAGLDHHRVADVPGDLDGTLGGFGIAARTTRYGEVVSPGAIAPIASPLSLTDYGPDDLFLKPKWITDLEVRYTISERVTWAFGAFAAAAVVSCIASPLPLASAIAASRG